MSEPLEKMRLDKWLWAARFFKTRPLAAEAISGGKVHLNGQRCKPGKEVKIGNRIEISKVPTTGISRYWYYPSNDALLVKRLSFIKKMKKVMRSAKH